MTETVWRVLVLLAVFGVAVEGLVLVGVLRHLGALMLQLGPPRHGEIEGAGPATGSEVEIDGLDADRSSILLFVGASCRLCPPVMSALPKVRSRYPEIQFVPIIIGDDPEEKVQYAEKLGHGARTDLDRLYQEWKVPGTPFTVAVGPDRRVLSSGSVNNLPQLETLAERVIVTQDHQHEEPVDGNGHAPIRELDMVGQSPERGR